MDPQVAQPKKRWPLSRKVTMILGASILVVIIIVLVAIFASKQHSTSQTQGQTVYYDRPGYNRATLGTGTADPFAVTFAKNNQPVEYQGNKVIQACNIVGVEDITKQDLLIKANTLPTPISQTYNDGVGKGQYPGNLFASSLSTLGLGMDINSCNYVLQAAEGSPSIGINVLQPFAVPPSIVDDEVQDNYAPVSPLEGLEVFRKQANAAFPGDKKSEFILRASDKAAFYIAIGLPSDKSSKEQAVLAAAAKNFVREQTSPTGPKTLSYTSPVFGKEFSRACDLLTNDSIRSLSGQDASPLAREGIASSIAILIGGENKTPYPNIRNECTRGTVSNSRSLAPGDSGFQMSVETTSFLSDLPAKKWVEAQHQTNQNNRANMDLSEKVGDGSVAYTDISGDHHVIFSKGRIVVDVSLDQNTGIRDLATAANKLTPITQAMSNRIKQ